MSRICFTKSGKRILNELLQKCIAEYEAADEYEYRSSKTIASYEYISFPYSIKLVKYDTALFNYIHDLTNISSAIINIICKYARDIIHIQCSMLKEHIIIAIDNVFTIKINLFPHIKIDISKIDLNILTIYDCDDKMDGEFMNTYMKYYYGKSNYIPSILPSHILPKYDFVYDRKDCQFKKLMTLYDKITRYITYKPTNHKLVRLIIVITKIFVLHIHDYLSNTLSI